MTVVAIIAPGAMGAAVAQRLTENGAAVITTLAGRGAASIARARAAGMQAVAEPALAEADFLLSILPPGQALNLAERLAPLLRGDAVYVDCNAVSPQTALRIAAVVEAAGKRFIDAAIIGNPPAPGAAAPIFYASGPDATALAALQAHGLQVKLLDGPVGAASALKMSYGGITKGLAALAAAMMLAATRAGAAPALRAELAASQPALLARFTHGTPDMIPKAYRWVAEMEEIAQFAGADAATRQIYTGIAALYQRLADDNEGAQAEIAQLAAFFAPVTDAG